MHMRTMVAGLMLLGLGVTLGSGCGGAREEYSVVEHPQSEASSAAGWTMPEPMVEQLRGCLEAHAGDLHTYSHETQFDVEVNEEGEVQHVKLRSSTLHHEAIESCMTEALAGLSVPSSVLTLRSSGPFSGGERMRDERGPLGIAQALAGAAAMGPIILMAAGVTLGVYIAVALTEEAIEAAKRNRRLNKMCKERLDRCLNTRPGVCGECFGFCLVQGYWPEHACPQYSRN